MADSTHHIGNLHVRTPAADDHAGPRIAEHIQQSLAELPAPQQDTHLGSLRLRVHVAADATDAELARALTRALTTALR